VSVKCERNVSFLCALIIRSGCIALHGNLSHNSLEKHVMFGTMPRIRRQGCHRRQWLDNITQWAEMGLVDIVRLAEDRNGYRRFVFGAAYAHLLGTANSRLRAAKHSCRSWC